MPSLPIRAAALALSLLVPGAVLAQDEQQAPAAGEETLDEAELAELTGAEDPSQLYYDLNLFGEVLDQIRAQYVDPPDDRELIRAAIQGMLTSLDPHSAYLPPVDYDDMQEQISGDFGGVGIEITMEEGLIKVISPIDETPAAKAGILANDLIVELDGQQVQGMTMEEALEKMRGEVGTPIRLTVVREGADKPLFFDLNRATIPVTVVRFRMEEDVAVIRLASFSRQAAVGMQKAVADMFEALEGEAPKGIILDLRNNPGGLVDQAVAVADIFLDRGAVVLMRGREQAEDARLNARPDPLDARLADIPIVVLINGGSASASEIVAGALQDHGRATLVGTRSYGKGSVQKIIPLGADGAMQLTTSRYYTPNNRSIQAAGVSPDIQVLEVVPEEFADWFEVSGEAGYDNQIGGGTEEATTVTSSVYVPSDPADDTQLQYALRLINGEETDPAYPAEADNAG